MIKTMIGITPVILLTTVVNSQDIKPNIVFILADDLGWKDPTFCEIAGITDLPDKVDGISIVPLLTGNGVYDSEMTLFWHYPHFSNQLGHLAGSVRAGDYKLVENYETKAIKLTSLDKEYAMPYPMSNLISGIQSDWSTHLRHAQGSDNFQLTWADDGHQYGIWGDGDGFAGTNGKYRVSLGVTRIEGEFYDYKGYDRYGHKGCSFKKAVK